MRISDWRSDVCASDLQPTIPKSTLWAGSRKCKVSTAVKDKNLIRSPSIQGWRQPLIILCLPSLLCHLVLPYLQVLPSLRSGSYLASIRYLKVRSSSGVVGSTVPAAGSDDPTLTTNCPSVRVAGFTINGIVICLSTPSPVAKNMTTLVQKKHSPFQ